MGRSRAGQAGQGATEYMLVIAVIVIAVVAASYTFVPQFRAGVESLAQDVNQALSTGEIAGLGGFNRDGAGIQANPSIPGDGTVVLQSPSGPTTVGMPGDGTFTSSYRPQPKGPSIPNDGVRIANGLAPPAAPTMSTNGKPTVLVPGVTSPAVQ